MSHIPGNKPEQPSRTVESLKKLIKQHFSLPIQFVEAHQMMNNIFSYKTVVNNRSINVTPCGDHLRVCIE